MVLHNDKWKKKATKLNNKKHGVSNYKGKNTQGTPTLELDDHPEAVRRRELAEAAMNPPAEPQSVQTLESDTASEFDFSENGDLDSDEEANDHRPGPGPIKGLPSQRIARDDASRLTASKAAVSKTIKETPHGPTSATSAGQDEDDESATPGVYARRKLVDNSWRYEDEYFDPHLQEPGMANRTEIPDDFTGLQAREFELNEAERVPESSTRSRIRQDVKPMDDSSAFEALRKAQQQEEIARDLKARYGVRRGYAKVSEPALDDDLFFSQLALQNVPEQPIPLSSTSARNGTPDEPLKSRSEHDKKLESYLDKLLGL
ncbi:hypothetical protein BCR37DRAFT_385279 [Protomyces lactucae-debilis]|uniref:Uncharacterized protein n=1 Tax=Protomyces lactucae-debilis TaxID=2754530 RepID=A0A1Y2FVV1_PROLT|nr:uncharacterized protein BCR37DRAFT_385279 [Protomyces lactucae-debilis]ORY86805.1 hypothetical protein BCR37DRAFT_385279 [Protomyces lactucae-debilis]